MYFALFGACVHVLLAAIQAARTSIHGKAVFHSSKSYRSFRLRRRGELGRSVPPFHRCSTLWSHSRAEVKVYLCLSSIAGLTSSSRPWSPRKREPEKLGQHFKPEETETRRGKRRGTRDVQTETRRWEGWFRTTAFVLRSTLLNGWGWKTSVLFILFSMVDSECQK